MKSAILGAIDHANALGYAVKVKDELGQKRITCIYKNNTSSSSIVPQDHFTDKKFAAIIEHNIKRHKEAYSEDKNSYNSYIRTTANFKKDETESKRTKSTD